MKMENYRGFSLKKLTNPRFNHILLLIFWPLFAFFFYFLERGWPGRDYYYIYSRLDDLIPFCEFFVIPYLLWFAAIFGTLVYGFFFDIPTFKRLMKFIIITYTAAVVIYAIFPNAQGLRPTEFTRDNVFTRFMKDFYEFDTNTNVCPSIHVMGAVGVMLAQWHSKALSKPIWRFLSVILCVSICLSTVFLKQHSILDVIPAVVICVVAYPFAFENLKYSIKIGKSKSCKKALQ